MTFLPHGKNLVGGSWKSSARTFVSSPVDGGKAHHYSSATVESVDAAAQAAEEAFWSFGYSARETRANFLERIADEIENRGEEITDIGCQETGLPAARFVGERGRTVGQLRLFASHARAGGYLDRRYDAALPNRQPLPPPDLRMLQRPIGPVAVFGASNFPLAFSVAGGDTASALAAGCPVVVKGHPAHPGTSEVVAGAVAAAVAACDLHPGVFSMLHGDTLEAGAALVQHPHIKAVGFTGSLRGGRALFDLCAQREEPIPFFGELGSVNPSFVFDGAFEERGREIGEGWAASLTMGAGQFCTNPGVSFVPEDGAEDFVDAALVALSGVSAQTMLTDGIAKAYHDGCRRVAATVGVTTRCAPRADGRLADAAIYSIARKNWAINTALAEEVFGPLGIVVTVDGTDDMIDAVKSLEGQLTCTLHVAERDNQDAARLVPILERKAGRLLVNGFPTGVEVCDAMVHGGPYPASTNAATTLVGTLAIRRLDACEIHSAVSKTAASGHSETGSHETDSTLILHQSRSEALLVAFNKGVAFTSGACSLFFLVRPALCAEDRRRDLGGELLCLLDVTRAHSLQEVPAKLRGLAIIASGGEVIPDVGPDIVLVDPKALCIKRSQLAPRHRVSVIRGVFQPHAGLRKILEDAFALQV